MKERPILFNSEMVRAILDGRKTQTRRVIKPQPEDNDGRYLSTRHRFEFYGGGYSDHGVVVDCPYGAPGDLLWVRETWAKHCIGGEDYIFYRADSEPDGDGAPWRPSIHMPRWASRITLRVVDVRVERVQEISGRDAWAEGIACNGNGDHDAEANAIDAFRILWDSINAARGHGWDTNPWIWVVEFEAVTA